MLLAILALLVFGPEGLPEILRTGARTYRAFRQAATDFQSEVNSALTVEGQKQDVARRRRKRSVPEEQKLAAAAALNGSSAETAETSELEEDAEEPGAEKNVEAKEAEEGPQPSLAPESSDQNSSPALPTESPETLSSSQAPADSPTVTVAVASAVEAEEAARIRRLSGDADLPPADAGEDDEIGPRRPMARKQAQPAAADPTADLEPVT